MSRQRPFGFLSFVLFTGLFSVSCSGPVTCALEGCQPEGGVVLANEPKAGESADATAQKDELASKIKDIADRLGATEALAALLQETVKLHDARIKSLEDGAKSVDGRLADIDGMIEHHEEEIHAQAKALAGLESSLTARLEAQAAAEKEALDLLRSDLTTAEDKLRESIKTLDESTQKELEGILLAMAEERLRVDAADAAVAADAQDKLNTLQKALEARVVSLENMNETLVSEIARLDGRVNGVICSNEREFRKLWASYGLLQAQLILVAADNAIENQRLRKEIKDTDSKLREMIKGLQASDASMASDIMRLKNDQDKTRRNLAELEDDFEDFVKAQKATNAAINSSYSSLSRGLSDLKTTMNNHINSESDRVTEIVNDLLDPIAQMVNELEDETSALQSSLNNLGGRVGSLEGSYRTLRTDHDALKSRYDSFVSSTNTKLTQLNEMFANGLSTCSIKPVSNGNGHGNSNRVVLKCGSTSVTLSTSGN